MVCTSYNWTVALIDLLGEVIKWYDPMAGAPQIMRQAEAALEALSRYLGKHARFGYCLHYFRLALPNCASKGHHKLK